MTKVEQAKLDEVKDLLSIINERQKVIKEESLPEINERLKSINGNIEKHTENLNVINTTLYGKTGDAGLCKQVDINTNRIVKLMIVAAVVGATVGGGIGGLIQLLT